MAKTYYYTVEGEIIGEHTLGQSRLDYLTDGLGSVVATVDQTVTVKSTARYKPYGADLATTGTQPAFGFTGNTGSRRTGRPHMDLYNQSRHLGTAEGRWTTVDELFPSESAYVYVADSPTSWIDPSGMQLCPPILGSDLLVEEPSTANPPRWWPKPIRPWGWTGSTVDAGPVILSPKPALADPPTPRQKPVFTPDPGRDRSKDRCKDLQYRYHRVCPKRSGAAPDSFYQACDARYDSCQLLWMKANAWCSCFALLSATFRACPKESDAKSRAEHARQQFVADAYCNECHDILNEKGCFSHSIGSWA